MATGVTHSEPRTLGLVNGCRSSRPEFRSKRNRFGRSGPDARAIAPSGYCSERVRAPPSGEVNVRSGPWPAGPERPSRIDPHPITAGDRSFVPRDREAPLADRRADGRPRFLRRGLEQDGSGRDRLTVEGHGSGDRLGGSSPSLEPQPTIAARQRAIAPTAITNRNRCRLSQLLRPIDRAWMWSGASNRTRPGMNASAERSVNLPWADASSATIEPERGPSQAAYRMRFPPGNRSSEASNF